MMVSLVLALPSFLNSPSKLFFGALLSMAVSEKTIIKVPGWPDSPLYSHAVVSNGMVYVAGTIGVDMTTSPPTKCAGGIKNETTCALANVATVLNVAGSSFDKVPTPSTRTMCRNLLCSSAEWWRLVISDCGLHRLSGHHGRLRWVECGVGRSVHERPTGSRCFWRLRARDGRGRRGCACQFNICTHCLLLSFSPRADLSSASPS